VRGLDPARKGKKRGAFLVTKHFTKGEGSLGGKEEGGVRPVHVAWPARGVSETVGGREEIFRDRSKTV